MINGITLLDTVTGEIVSIETDRSAFYWAESDGSCDCNRELKFGRDTNSGRCLGKKRYLIIESTYEGYTLGELNDGYPDGLLLGWLVIMKSVNRIVEELINGSPGSVEPVGILGSSKESTGERRERSEKKPRV